MNSSKGIRCGLGVILSCLLAAWVQAQEIGTWIPTSSMSTPRFWHTATLLPNGKVLVAGGDALLGVVLSSAELYDAVTGQFSPTGPMSTSRMLHTATLLDNGKVLIAGGYSQRDPYKTLDSAELYDPATGTFSPTGSMGAPRAEHRAILLTNGKALLVAGQRPPSHYWGLASAELYDPLTGEFSPTGSLSQQRHSCAAVRLDDGRVLVAGGHAINTLNRPEMYDPTTETFSSVPPMTTSRSNHAAILLNTGKVLIAGGWQFGSGISSAELYDPQADTFTPTGALSAPLHWLHSPSAPVLLRDGRILFAGGFNGPPTSRAELYDPSTGTFGVTGSMSEPRGVHTVTLLSNGNVLVTGGTSGTVLSTAELYIAEPLEVPFAQFRISKANLRFAKVEDADSLSVHGSFTLGENSDGINLDTDDVTVKVGVFEQTIPAGSFQKVGNGGEYRFRSQEPGIRFMSINVRKGTFKVEAKDVNLDGMSNPVTIELAIGNDEGSETLRLRGNLKYEGHEDEDHHDDHGD